MSKNKPTAQKYKNPTEKSQFFQPTAHSDSTVDLIWPFCSQNKWKYFSNDNNFVTKSAVSKKLTMRFWLMTPVKLVIFKQKVVWLHHLLKKRKNILYYFEKSKTHYVLLVSEGVQKYYKVLTIRYFIKKRITIPMILNKI